MAMKAAMKLKFSILCLVPFIMVLGNSMLIPVLPAMQNALGVDEARIGLLVTAFSIPAGIVIPFAGILSDHVGRKTIMAPALVIYGLGGLICGLASLYLGQKFLGIIVGRIIQGIGAGGTYQLAMALTGDIFKSRERTKSLGLLEASNGLGKVVSPILGAAIGLLAWYAPFFTYGALAIPVAVAVWLMVEEAGERKKQPLPQYFNDVKEVFRGKGASLLSSFFLGMVALFTLFGVLSLYSDILEEQFGVTGFVKGFVMAGPVLVMAATSLTLGVILQRKLAKLLKPALVAGIAAIIAGLILMALLSAQWLLFAAICVIGLGTGAVLPSLNTLITSCTDKQKRGLITCLYGTVRFFGVAFGPPLFGFAATIGKAPILLGAAALAGGAGVIGLLLIKPKIMLPEKLLSGESSSAGDTNGTKPENTEAGLHPAPAALGVDPGTEEDRTEEDFVWDSDFKYEY
ncbi:MAG: MFS transporter [bacterium]